MSSLQPGDAAVVSKSQLDRLSARIDALAPRQDYRFAVILVHVGETEAQARNRHYREQPEDRAAAHEIMVMFVAPEEGRPCRIGVSSLLHHPALR